MSEKKPPAEKPKTLKQWQLRKMIRQYLPTATIIDGKSGEMVVIVPRDKD
jgi:hypothetical protein